MINRFFPQEFNFFNLFNQQMDCLLEGADAFKRALEKGVVDPEYLRKIKEIESKADQSAGAIISQLNKSFITPFDREDIHGLATVLDDVIDMLNTIANRLAVYKISEVPKDFIGFSLVIEETIRTLASAVKGLKSMKNYDVVMSSCVEVSRMENIADAMRDTALAGLFESEKNPVVIIKWKELYEDAETVVDICEDAAHVVEAIMLKQA